jgi:hypothetical protein
MSAHDTDAALLLHERHVHAVLARVHRQNGHAAVPAHPGEHEVGRAHV